MKIRIFKDSIRFRLSQPEVKALAEKGLVSATCQLGPNPSQSLQWTLMRHPNDEFGIRFDSGGSTVFLPTEAIHSWATTDEVGIRHTFQFNNGAQLHFLLEKDFKCLTPRDEDESENFPNPNQSC